MALMTIMSEKVAKRKFKKLMFLATSKRNSTCYSIKSVHIIWDMIDGFLYNIDNFKEER